MSGLVEVEGADHSTEELIDAAAAIQAVRGVEEGQDPILTDVSSNQLKVPVSPAPSEDADVKAAILDANEEDSAIARSAVEREITPMAECRYSYQLCDAPLRGGISMIATNNSGLCTAGFNVESKADGALYVLTAGHCTAGGDTWITEFSDGGTHTVGSTWPGRTYYPGNDVGLIRVQNVAGWNPQWWVLVRASNGSSIAPATTQNERYPIYGTAVSIPDQGYYVCKTGAVSATTCGEITATGQTGNYGQGDIVNLGEARMRACQGDSGGPVYKSNTAYGIISGGDITSHISIFNTGIDLGGHDIVYGNVGCSQSVLYMGIRSALGLTNTKLIGT